MLYSEAKFGTKNLIHDYLDEVSKSLHFLCDNEFAEFPFTRKLAFFNETGQAFGQSALMLSGGAALGLFHIGVLRTLFNEDLIPTVISGSSAGSMMVAALGTHTDEELDALFTSDQINVDAFKLVGLRGLLEGKSLMDADYLEKCLDTNVGDITFEEAYKKTGRKINITVSPADPLQDARLLNTRMSPNVLVAKASLASCAAPGVYPPVMLWAKDFSGKKVPYMPNRRWVDGTIKNDLPIVRLARLYGVNHTIVSQTNPHVVPFISLEKDRDNLISMAKKFLRTNVSNNLSLLLEGLTKTVRQTELSLIFDKIHSLVTQPYVGDINIVPPWKAAHLTQIFSNASAEELTKYIEAGSRETWPKVEMIRNTTQISRTFKDCNMKLKKLQDEKLNAVALQK
jgi:predicted acylesterase/phospholipase RssA